MSRHEPTRARSSYSPPSIRLTPRGRRVIAACAVILALELVIGASIIVVHIATHICR